MPLPTIAYAGPFPCWIGFFTLGIALTLLLIGFLITILTSYYFHVGDGQKPSHLFYRISFDAF